MASSDRSILLLGDSLSASYGLREDQGWVHLLNQKLIAEKSPYHIINASISGETSGGGLSRLPNILTKEKIDSIIIELGGNDGLRGFNPKITKNNLLQIIQLAKQKNINIYLMEIHIPPNYGPKYNQLFTGIYQEIAEQEKVTLLPFFMEKVAIDKTLMQKDGIHPNLAAQPIITEIMAKQIQQFFQE